MKTNIFTSTRGLTRLLFYVPSGLTCRPKGWLAEEVPSPCSWHASHEGNRERTLYEKILETGWALLLEELYSKEEILNLYASHAPFGGNVVGIETAAWRYFGRSAHELSWAESATLAVLPNSPALIHPGRNQAQLKAKRDRLLSTLKKKGLLDETDYELACLEPLPEVPLPLPDEAPHLLERLMTTTQGARIQTSVRYAWQRQVQTIVNQYAQTYRSNHIHNVAAIITDTETGEVLGIRREHDPPVRRRPRRSSRHHHIAAKHG